MVSFLWQGEEVHVTAKNSKKEESLIFTKI